MSFFRRLTCNRSLRLVTPASTAAATSLRDAGELLLDSLHRPEFRFEYDDLPVVLFDGQTDFVLRSAEVSVPHLDADFRQFVPVVDHASGINRKRGSHPRFQARPRRVSSVVREPSPSATARRRLSNRYRWPTPRAGSSQSLFLLLLGGERSPREIFMRAFSRSAISRHSSRV